MNFPETYISDFHNSDAVKNMVYSKLGNTDLNISRISLGGGAFSGFYGEFDDNEGIATIEEAIKSGINYIDTAPYYGEGRSEILIGKALRKIPRKSYYISTKVGRYTSKWETMFDYSRETIVNLFEKSLQRLGIEYVDIIIVHDVEFADKKQILEEALPAVKELKDQGKVRYIAVSGYPLSKLWEVISESQVKIDVVLTYSRDTLIDLTLRKKYQHLFQQKGLGIINAAPTAMQMLTNDGCKPWHPASKDIKELCAKAAEYCKEKGVELGTLAFFHTFSNPDSHTCLVGMISREILRHNLGEAVNGLSEKEKKVLKYLKEKYFTNAEDLHWEGVEVATYKSYMASHNGKKLN